MLGASDPTPLLLAWMGPLLGLSQSFSAHDS